MPARPTGRPLAYGSLRVFRVPRNRDGSIRSWVFHLARLRASGMTNVQALSRATGRSWQRIYAVMRDPDYQDIEIRESLRLLEERRGKALAALADRAESGDPSAVRLVAELTGLVEPIRPVLVSLQKITKITIPAQDSPVQIGGDASKLASERDDFFTKLLGEPSIDVIFREKEKSNGKGNGHE